MKKKPITRSLVLMIQKEIHEPNEKAYTRRLNRIIKALEGLEWAVNVESEEDVGEENE